MHPVDGIDDFVELRAVHDADRPADRVRQDALGRCRRIDLLEEAHDGLLGFAIADALERDWAREDELAVLVDDAVLVELERGTHLFTAHEVAGRHDAHDHVLRAARDGLHGRIVLGLVDPDVLVGDVLPEARRDIAARELCQRLEVLVDLRRRAVAADNAARDDLTGAEDDVALADRQEAVAQILVALLEVLVVHGQARILACELRVLAGQQRILPLQRSIGRRKLAVLRPELVILRDEHIVALHELRLREL